MEVGGAGAERMTGPRMSQSHRWWFDSHKAHNNNASRSHWLQSTLSELDERTKAMLTIIEQDADSFAQRAEMYYKKRPQLISMVEDFYRAHRSLAEQIDHLKHDPGTRLVSPLARSLSLLGIQQTAMLDLHKSYDGCFTKLGFDYSEESYPSLTISKGQSEQVMNSLKSFDESFTDLSYCSMGEELVESEVDDPVSEDVHSGEEEDGEIDFGDEMMMMSHERNDEEKMVLRRENERLIEENAVQKNQLAQKERVIDELKRKVSENTDELVEMREEIDMLRVENAEIYLLKRKDVEEETELLRQERVQLSSELKKRDCETREMKKKLEAEVAELKVEAEQLRAEKAALVKLRDSELNALRQEIERLKSENGAQRELLEQKDEEKNVAPLTMHLEAQVAELKVEAEQPRAEKATHVKLGDSELNALLQELENLKSENGAQRELLEQKDEDKREVIRQLSMAMMTFKDENQLLKNTVCRERHISKRKKNHPVDNQGLMKGLLAKLFSWSSASQAIIVPL